MRDFIGKSAPGAFGPDDIDVLADAFEDIWKAVLVSGAPFADDRYQQRARQIIAAHILQLARLGERDRRKLSQSALLELARANLKPDS